MESIIDYLFIIHDDRLFIYLSTAGESGLIAFNNDQLNAVCIQLLPVLPCVHCQLCRWTTLASSLVEYVLTDIRMIE